MKTFVLDLNAKYHTMVINAETEEEAIKIATSRDIKVNPLYRCDEEQIFDIYEINPNKPGILTYM